MLLASKKSWDALTTSCQRHEHSMTLRGGCGACKPTVGEDPGPKAYIGS